MKRTLIWIGALLIGAVLGLLGIEWLDKSMEFIALVYTRLFQLLAVPTIVLAVITTFATFGSNGSGKIFGRTITYTLLTTFAAAAVGAILYVLIAPGNLPASAISDNSQFSIINSQLSYSDHVVSIIPNNIIRPFLDGNVLSLLILAFAVGLGLSKLPDSENKAIVVKGLVGLQDLLFLLIRGLVWTLPLGIVAFSAQLSAQLSAGVIADSIGKYVLVPAGTRSESVPCFRSYDTCCAYGSLYQKQCCHSACHYGNCREPSWHPQQCVPFCAPYLHHHQYERLCGIHTNHFTVCYAERRYADYLWHYTVVDTDFGYIGHR